jgi:diguanylate cyclase (GGDEF)-like protein
LTASQRSPSRGAPPDWRRGRALLLPAWLRLAAVLCLAALAAWPAAGRASTHGSDSALLLNDIAHAFPASAKTMYLEDPEGRLRIEDVSSDAMRERFRATGPHQNAPNFGFSRSAYWLALPITLAADCPPRWLLEAGFPSLDRVDVFTPRPDGGYFEQTAGDLQPFASRLYPHRNLVFPITLVPGQTQTLYVRVQSTGSLTVPLTLWQADILDAHDQQTYALLGVFYGAMLALFFYNLLLYFAMRDNVFLAYVGFVAATAVGMASLNGLGNQFLWPGWSEWGDIAQPASLAVAGLFGAYFTRLFLETQREHPGLDRLLFTLSLIFAFAAVMPLVFDYRFVALVASVNGLVFSCVAIYAGCTCRSRRKPGVAHPGARYFVIAWSMLLLGTTLQALRSIGWIPTFDLTTYAIQAALALVTLLLSAAMAERIQTMRRDAIAAEHAMVEALLEKEHGLEERVMERTRELEQANAELRAKEKELEYMARHDPLTGLPNRALLDDRLEQALARAKRSGRNVAVMLADLDRFKAINDTYGHPVGDQMLKMISGRMTDCLRSADTLARVGGDEFVIILEEIQDPADASGVADKLIAAACRVVELPQGPLQVGVCIGIAYYPLNATDARSLVRHADDAMYAAKAAGGNCWRTA